MPRQVQLSRHEAHEWARENASTLGVRYASELARRRDRLKSYDEL